MRLKKFKTFENKLIEIKDEIISLLPLGINESHLNICSIYNTQVNEYIINGEKLYLEILINIDIEDNELIDFINQVNTTTLINYDEDGLGYSSEVIEYNGELLELYIHSILFELADSDFKPIDVYNLLNVEVDIVENKNIIANRCLGDEAIDIISGRKLSQLHQNEFFINNLTQYKFNNLNETEISYLISKLDSITPFVKKYLIDKWNGRTKDTYGLEMVNMEDGFKFELESVLVSIRDLIYERNTLNLNTNLSFLLDEVDNLDIVNEHVFEVNLNDIKYIIMDIIEDNDNLKLEL